MSTTVSEPAVAADVRRGHAAMIGLVAVAAAIGSGHLVAGIVSPTSSPYLAVGNAVVRLAPAPLVEFAKETFGTADKVVLLGGMTLIIALAAVAIGLAGRFDPRRGTMAITALGLIGLVAVWSGPTFAPLDILAPGASLIGVTVFRRLHELAANIPDEQPGKPDPGGISRRRWLIGSSAAVGAGALGAAGIGQLLGTETADSRDSVTRALAGTTVAEPAPRLPAGVDFHDLGTPAFLTPNSEFYRIDTALRIPVLSAANWRLRVHGMVDRELTLTFDDVLARPLVERDVTLVCVSNEVGDSLISTARFTGVDLRDILLEAGVRPGANEVLSTSSDGWTAGTPTDLLLEPDRGALLAIGMNGEALPAEHGFPARLVVPGLYGFVSATKWVTDLELTTFAMRRGYWQPRGWATLSPVKTQSRIDTPRRFSRPSAGRVPIAGIAWSQPDGISAVEVRVDGRPWQQAELSTEVSGDTWRMWKTVVDVAPGEHVAQVRATNARGVTQTEELAPVAPDGATGWHTVTFSTR